MSPTLERCEGRLLLAKTLYIGNPPTLAPAQSDPRGWGGGLSHLAPPEAPVTPTRVDASLISRAPGFRH